jgi:autotransporter passenger strand-loop-strand repeat protein
MTNYSAPPDITGLVLNHGDSLKVEAGGKVTGATINNGGIETVETGGTAFATTIDKGGNEFVQKGAVSSGTVIDGGTVQVFGTDTGATINAGAEWVQAGGVSSGATINGGGKLYVVGGTAIGTTINNGGLEFILPGGAADGVTFGGNSGRLELANPAKLTGTISDWKVGDVVDLRNVTVTKMSEVGNILTLTYANNKTVTYTLEGQQANTQVKLEPDLTHTGTDLALIPIVGVHTVHEVHHFFG